MSGTVVICPGNASEAKECMSTTSELKQGKYWLLHKSVNTDGILLVLTISPKFQGLVTSPPHSVHLASGRMNVAASATRALQIFRCPGHIWNHFKENPALYLTSLFYLLTTLIRLGRGKANRTGRMDYLHSCKRLLSDGVEWIEL